ncbi:MAG: hypothetical protein ABGX23_05250 [Nautiliaceae bacterium]
MQRIGLLVGLLLVIIGLYRIDLLLYKTLDYFGKYVFFGLFNIMSLFLVFYFYKKFDGILKITMPLLFGLIVALIGFFIA